MKTHQLQFEAGVLAEARWLDFYYQLANNKYKMDVNEEYKEEVRRQLLISIASALENGSVKEEDLPSIATYVLDHMTSIKTHPELVAFLDEMTKKWGFFGNIANTEMARVIEKKKGAVVENVLQLAKDGKLDEAVSVAKSLSTTQ